MKTKKCFDICKKSGVFYVYQAEYNEQWLPDGSACYPITGLPMLTEDSICKLYDINDTQRNKVCVQACRIYAYLLLVEVITDCLLSLNLARTRQQQSKTNGLQN